MVIKVLHQRAFNGIGQLCLHMRRGVVRRVKSSTRAHVVHNTCCEQHLRHSKYQSDTHAGVACRFCQAFEGAAYVFVLEGCVRPAKQC